MKRDSMSALFHDKRRFRMILHINALKILPLLAALSAMILFACAGMSSAAAGQPEQEAPDTGEFIQITSMRLCSGEQVFEAFRIMQTGTVEWARWDTTGRLLDYAEPVDMGKDVFYRAMALQSFRHPPPSPEDDGTLGRPAFRLEIAAITESGVKAVFLQMMPPDIGAITDELRHDVRDFQVQRQPGWYIWTKPYPRRGNADIDLRESGGDPAVAGALSEAISTGRLIVSADDAIRALTSMKYAGRIMFTARTKSGDLHFGILSVK